MPAIALILATPTLFNGVVSESVEAEDDSGSFRCCALGDFFTDSGELCRNGIGGVIAYCGRGAASSNLIGLQKDQIGYLGVSEGLVVVKGLKERLRWGLFSSKVVVLAGGRSGLLDPIQTCAKE